MIAILKHELRTYFRTLTAYIFGAFLLVFIGLGAMLYNIQAAVSNFEFVLSFASLIFVVIVPILTMRVIAEERKQKTDVLLYSLPLTTPQIVLGKYLSLLIVYLIPLCIISVYPLIFSQFGDVYLLTSYASLFAFFIMGAALLALGLFISSITENQGFAAGIGIAIVLFNYYSVSLAEVIASSVQGSMIAVVVIILALGVLIRHVTKNETMALSFSCVCVIATLITYLANASIFESLLTDIMKNLSLFERFYSFTNGVFDITTIVFYITFAIFFLFLSVQSMEKRRYN